MHDGSTSRRKEKKGSLFKEILAEKFPKWEKEIGT